MFHLSKTLFHAYGRFWYAITFAVAGLLDVETPTNLKLNWSTGKNIKQTTNNSSNERIF